MRRNRAWAALAVALCLVTAACGGGGDEGEEEAADAGPVVIWSTETEPDRLQATQEIVDGFTEATGIEADLEPIEEDQLPSLIQSSAAADELPDVVNLPLAFAQQYASEQILDPSRAAEVIEALGADTFPEEALGLVDFEGEPAAVPTDGWGQLLFYRTDLFEAAGLEPPESFESIQAAAEALDSDGVAGITAATIPGDQFTQQSFEHFALANNCQLVDDEGTVTLDSPECVEALRFYTDLIRNYSVPGAQDVESTRATYFAGQAAMVVWSSFLLDELAGLRDDALPSCPECADNPSFLAENTGVVAAFTGPDGDEPAQFGDIATWGIPIDANPGANDFVEYMLGDGYLDWLGIAPEGKFPIRAGTAEDPEEFTTAWQELEVGVDRTEPFSEAYPAETVELLASAPANFTRWGFAQGQGPLVGAVYGELPVPAAIDEILNSGVDPEEAAATAQEEVTSIQESL
jgi:multiple sugar transport system substrate-binding protein